jgi:N-methylhydantoinase B
LPGTPNYFIIYSGGEPKGHRKIAVHRMLRGDMVSLRTGGGGGWGDPRQRDEAKVLLDILNEYITPEQARDVYGVSVDAVKMEIDEEATRKLRKRA